MITRTVRSFEELARVIQDDLTRKIPAIDRALQRVTGNIVHELQVNAPRAFGDLSDSFGINKVGPMVWEVYSTAPHLLPVDRGSRPHWPPLEPLIRWVKLRGMQGHAGSAMSWKKGERRQKAHARDISKMFNVLANIRSGAGIFAKASRDADPEHNSVDDPEVIARMIQKAIGIGGTKPQPFTRKSMRAGVRDASRYLQEELRRDQ